MCLSFVIFGPGILSDQDFGTKKSVKCDKRFFHKEFHIKFLVDTILVEPADNCVLTDGET